MATIMEETSTEKLGKPKVSRSDRKAYQQSVLDNVCDSKINFAARRLDCEWRADRRTYEVRLQACKTLKEDVPELERVAAEAARAAAEAESFARSAVPNTLTVAELRARLHAAHPNLPASTPAELAQGLLFLVGTMPGQHIGNLKSKAISARSAVADTISRARQVLNQTAAEHREDPEVAKLAAKIAELEHRIRGREPILGAEGQATLARAECEKLARGDRPSDFSSYHQPGQQRPPLAALYRAARARLDSLLDLVARKPDAIRDNQRDLEELTQLRVKLAETQRASVDRLADPKAMRWCE